MRTRVTISISFVLLLLIGCGETASDRNSGGTWNPSEQTGADEVAGGEENGEPETRPVCAPRVRGFSIESPPAPPSDLLEGSCPLNKTVFTRNGGRSERTREFDVLDEGRRYRSVSRRDGSFEYRRVWTFDGNGRRVEVEETSSISYGGDRRTRTWMYDDRGRIQTYRELEHDTEDRSDPEFERIVRRSWVDGNPSGKVVTIRESGEEQTVRFDWEHRDGRLVRATVRGDTTRRTVEWTYRDGAPVRVVRRMDGVPYERQTWRREGGSLTSRKVTFSGSGLSGELDVEEWPPQPRLDSAVASTPVGPYYRTSGGETAPGPEPQSSGCRSLRSAPGFGHPPGHRAYRLGWEDGDGPEAIASLYRWAPYGGANRFYSSYGHEGAVPGSPPIVKWRNSSERTAVEIDYDGANRPVEIRAKTGPHGEEPRLEFVRERRIEDDTLLEDRLEVKSESGDQVRTLSFRWDGEQLRRRELRIDGRVAERQIWRHPGDRTSELELLSVFDGASRYGVSAPPILPSLDEQENSDLETTATLRRREDGKGRPVHRVTPAQYRRSQLETVTYEYGPHGISQRKTERNGEVVTTTFEYDARGRKIRKTQMSTQERFVPRNVEWTYRDDRLVERRVYTDEGTSLRTLEREFVCED